MLQDRGEGAACEQHAARTLHAALLGLLRRVSLFGPTPLPLELETLSLCTVYTVQHVNKIEQKLGRAPNLELYLHLLQLPILTYRTLSLLSSAVNAIEIYDLI